MPAPPALLLIAHGTRAPQGAIEMEHLLATLRQRHRGPLAHAWLEDFARPDTVSAVGKLVADGADRVVVIPFLNFAAYHARSDVPGQVALAQAAHPQLRFTIGEVLGHHDNLLELAARRVQHARAAADLAELPSERELLLVTASGSSNANANSEVAKAARLLAERTGHRWVEYAFAGVTWPTSGEVVNRCTRAGAEHVVLFSWSLLAGVLERKVAEETEQAAKDADVPFSDAHRFGPDDLVADAVMDRFEQAATAAFPWD